MATSYGHSPQPPPGVRPRSPADGAAAAARGVNPHPPDGADGAATAAWGVTPTHLTVLTVLTAVAPPGPGGTRGKPCAWEEAEQHRGYI